MASELYKLMPWARGLTGNREDRTGAQQHEAMKNKSIRHMTDGGVQRPKGANTPGRSSALPSLRRGDDIPAALYPEGVSTGVGGGNAAQSVPKPAAAPPNPVPTITPTDTGRGEVRQNAKGVVQTGTQTGVKAMTIADANGLLSGGYQIENPFASNSLPGTNTSAYKQNPQTTKFDAPAIDINTGARQQTLSNNLFASGGAIVPFGQKVPDMPTSGYIQQQQTIGSPNLTQSGAVQAEKPTGDSKNSGINWGARKPSDNSDENVRRRAAMLNGDVNILQAMRNQEAIQGRVYAGGKHYQVNPNKGQEGQNDFMEISADSARQRSYGNMTAQQVADKHMKKAASKPGAKAKPTMVTDVVDEVATSATPRPSTGVRFNNDATFAMPDNNIPSFGSEPKRKY